MKDKDTHMFAITWATSAVRGDVWIGVRSFYHEQYYDESGPIVYHPLQESKTDDLTYSDGLLFDTTKDYMYGERRLKGDCFYFKQSADFELRDSSCDKEKGFICLWTKPDCPPGYKYIGQLSDGRTCHAAPSSASDKFDDLSCDTGDDMQRTRYTPMTPYNIDRFRREFALTSPIWTDASMDPAGNWYLNGEDMFTNLFTDMRRIVEDETGDTTWVPDDSILNPNGTTVGCLEIGPTGLLNPRLDSDCEVTNTAPACEYRACMTKYGKQCQFPFRYKNETHPELTYKICSALDVYRPWCPTALDAALNVLEWGDCLEDCPSEIVNSVCLEEPQFPAWCDGTSSCANFTANYDQGSGAVTDEVTT